MSTPEPGNYPYRNVLLMVAELHQIGYQRLRITPGMAPSGLYWRCSIASAGHFGRQNSALLSRGEYPVARYTSGQEARYFGWEDAAADTPEQLAQKFIQRFPEIARSGQGADPDYADWFLEMLQLTAPKGLPIAYADWELPSQYLTAVGIDREVRIPLPPPFENG